MYCSLQDVEYLQEKGLDAHELKDGSLGLAVEVVPGEHGRGVCLMPPID